MLFLTNGVSARTKSKKAANIRKNECLNLFKIEFIKTHNNEFSDNQLDKVPLLKIIKN